MGCRSFPSCARSTPAFAIIVLSARGEVSDRVTGLDKGADDYLIKPFSLDDMFARVRAVRRRPSGLAGEEIRVGHLVYELGNDEVAIGKDRQELLRRELRVLATLMKRRGRQSFVRRWSRRYMVSTTKYRRTRWTPMFRVSAANSPKPKRV